MPWTVAGEGEDHRLLVPERQRAAGDPEPKEVVPASPVAAGGVLPCVVVIG